MDYSTVYVEGYLNGSGIDTRTDALEFRPFGDVCKDLKNKMDKLSKHDATTLWNVFTYFSTIDMWSEQAE